MSYMFNPDRRARLRTPSAEARTQRGISLIELLVAIAIGLLVISAAIATLVLSRGTAGTVSEVTQLQQQAAYGLRVIGLQLRQTGSLEPLPHPADITATTFGSFPTDFIIVNGTEGAGTAPDTFTVGTQAPLAGTLRRDCLGNTIAATATEFRSLFALNASRELTCRQVGAATGAQALISDVADMQIRYRVNTGTSDAVAATYRSFTASEMTEAHWPRVKAIEVCLDMVGTQAIPDGGNLYTNCQGDSVSRNSRTHLVYRNVFDVRRQRTWETPL